MLHIGDTDTTGCIAGAWYGALYGFGDVPLNLVKSIEIIDRLKETSFNLYKKYGK